MLKKVKVLWAVSICIMLGNAGDIHLKGKWSAVIENMICSYGALRNKKEVCFESYYLTEFLKS